MYVYSGLQCWQATLAAPLAQDGVAPLVPTAMRSILCGVLGNGSHTYLVLTAPGLGCEIVKATCSYGTILLERGQDGTTAHAWPQGSCIEWALVGAAVRDLIAQTEACPTDCVAATIAAGALMPDGVQGTLYTHRIVISGTPPFALGIPMLPAWMTITLDGGEIRLEGTPPAPGAYNVSIPLKSCGVLAEFFRGCIYVTPAVVTPPV
jgi:hypothetical protein